MSRRFKPFKKQFTFLVLPDASSPVLRFRVSAALLVAIPVLICSPVSCFANLLPHS